MPEDYGEQQFKRVPMKEKSVKDLKATDIRVAILGTVVNVNAERLILDDGADSIEVMLPPETKVDANTLIRVIGRVRDGEGLHIEAEAVQNMTGLDVNLYKSLKALL